MRGWVLVAVVVGACEPQPAPCRIADSLAELAGPAPVDCGAFDGPTDPAEGWSCAIAAWQADTPFVFRYDEGAITSAVLHGVASDGERLFFLYQGKDRGVLRDVDGRECLAPIVADGILDCEQYEPADRVWQFCTTSSDDQADDADQRPFPG